METETSTTVPVTETVDRSFHSAGTPIATPNGNGGYFATDLEADLYEENKNLQGVLGKLTQFLAVRHPDLLHDMEKMNIFDELPDVETGASHSGHSTVPRNDSSNLRHAFDAESQSQPPPHTSTAGVTLGTNSSQHPHPVSSSVSFKNIFSGENILKPSVDDKNLKRENGVSEPNLAVNNQPVMTVPIISNNNSTDHLSLPKHGLDNLSSTMSAAKLQKSLSESAKRLKLKDFKYDANPSVCWRLFKSFYGQLVSILSGEEHFQGVLSDNFKITPFDDPYGTPNKVLFMLVLTYVDEHYKTVIRRKDTNGFGDKAILALQA
jgi:hypothetical protein